MKFNGRAKDLFRKGTGFQVKFGFFVVLRGSFVDLRVK